MSANGTGDETPPPMGTAFPFDLDGLQDSCERAFGRLWEAEVDRREMTGKPMHLFGIVTLALLHDDHAGMAVGLGIDYANFPDGDAGPMLAVIGQHLLDISRPKPAAAPVEAPPGPPRGPPAELP